MIDWKKPLDISDDNGKTWRKVAGYVHCTKDDGQYPYHVCSEDGRISEWANEAGEALTPSRRLRNTPEPPALKPFTAETFPKEAGEHEPAGRVLLGLRHREADEHEPAGRVLLGLRHREASEQANKTTSRLATITERGDVKCGWCGANHITPDCVELQAGTLVCQVCRKPSDLTDKEIAKAKDEGKI